ncbi:TetR/AcrR family transcriptional regulator [Deinococcus wulumuqiensis]|uniref:TetR/AcrR family transcriptional regulator n=1 Tax=Deinococcus wulumuqiensis TaxID=980427 RepID=UPI00242B74DE|nr:TetR family transcriptional regulator C-terminal domain-containing protein [Deinococcus wulumuqiensis]
MPRIVDHDQRRQELVHHVWALIRREGLDGVTIRNLSRQSGWSSGAIRHYLPTHDSILTFAAEQLARAVEQELRALPLQGPPQAQLESFLLALLPLSGPSREWTEVWLAFASAAVRGEQYADAHGILYRDLHATLLNIMRSLAQAELLRTETPEQAAAGLHALIDGLCLHLLMRQLTPDEAKRALLQRVRTLLVADTDTVSPGA